MWTLPSRETELPQTCCQKLPGVPIFRSFVCHNLDTDPLLYAHAVTTNAAALFTLGIIGSIKIALKTWTGVVNSKWYGRCTLLSIHPSIHSLLILFLSLCLFDVGFRKKGNEQIVLQALPG